jgi:hypothetical protein
MRTGKLSISRGHELLRERPAPVQAPVRPVSFTPCGETGELHLIQVRLNALERLTRLVEQGVISLDEFKLEKSLVLRLTGEELLLTKAAPPPAPQRRASLAARIPRWTLALTAPLAAFGASLWAAPAQTMAWFELFSG